MKWIIQDDVLAAEELTKIMARERNQEVYEFEYIPFQDAEDMVPVQSEKSVFRGSLEMADKLEDRSDILVFGNSEEFTYSNFYDDWQDYLLNKNVEYIQVSDFSDEIFDDSRIKFVRPDKGDKAFTGQCFELDDTWQACKDFVERNTDPNDWLVVSSKKDIGEEYRFVVFEDEILTGSQYYSEDSVEYDSISKDHGAWIFAQKVTLNRSHPAPFWVLDVCKHNGEFKVIELNSFSCASWYYSYRGPIFNKLEEFLQ